MKTIWLHLSIAALAASSVHSAEYITDMSVVTEAREADSTPRIVGPTASVTSITTGSGSFSNFTGPTSSLHVSGTAHATTHQFQGTEGETVYPNEADTLLGNNLIDATLIGSGNSTVFTMMFDQEIFDNDSGADTSFELFFIELVISENENFSLQAITGGTLENPILGGTAFVYNSTYRSTFGTFDAVRDNPSDPDNILTVLYREDQSSFLQGHYGGMGFDLSSDLGVDSLMGLRYGTASGSDPAAFLAVVPEPSSLVLVAGAMALLSVIAGRRRRG